MSNERKRAYDRDYRRRWRATHPEEMRQRNRRYNAANRDKINAHKRTTGANLRRTPTRLAWLAANDDRRRAYWRDYDKTRRVRTPDQMDRAKKRYAEWARENRGLVAYYARLRYARKKNAPGSHTFAEWVEKIALLGGCCIYCGRSDVRLTADHKVPIIRGGSDNIDNVVPACGSCNSKKRHRTASEYLALLASRRAA